MDKSEQALLIQAFKKEKDPVKKNRIHAVCTVKISEISVSDAAALFFCDPHTVAEWVRRYDSKGLAGLDDKPRSGRPRKVKIVQIQKILARTNNITTPKQLRHDIHQRHGVKYHITNIRKIMASLGLSSKTIQRVHVKRADIEEIRKWQRNTTRRISRLEKQGFATVIFDEAIFVDDPESGVKYWSPVGTPLITTYKGRHGRSVAYGSLSTDGRQFIRTCDRFDKYTTLKYLKELVRHFERVTIIMDNAPQHKARIVTGFLKNNPNVRVIWLPAATPEVSAIEEYWYQSKRDILVSEYYATIVEMRKALSEYFRTSRHHIDVIKFIRRKSFPVKNF